MNLDAALEQVVVVSDLHLGSPASTASDHLPAFLDHLAETGWSLCIDGDAIDLLQYTLPRLIGDLSRVAAPLRRLVESGATVHYVLGNHDLAVEHLLADLPMRVSPVLNLCSGSARIRIEHGHLHEPLFASHPGLYELAGRIGGLALRAHGDVYQHYARLQQALHRSRRRGAATYPSHEAAAALLARGFDGVVFGHTHLPEVVELDGGTFVNCGDWMHSRTYVTIDRGAMALRRWPDDGPLPVVRPAA